MLAVTIFRFIMHFITALMTFVVGASRIRNFKFNYWNCTVDQCPLVLLQDVLHALILSITISDLAGIPNDIKYVKLLLKEGSPLD